MLVVVTTGCVGWVALKWLQFTRIPCQSVGGMELAQLLVRYRGDLGKMVVSLNATYGHAPLKVFLFGVVRLILVSSPGMQELSPTPKGTFYAMLRVFFGRNLITLNHEAHRRHRRVMSQGFSVNALNAVIPSINRHAERLVKAWGPLKEVNVEEWMTRVRRRPTQPPPNAVIHAHAPLAGGVVTPPAVTRHHHNLWTQVVVMA